MNAITTAFRKLFDESNELWAWIITAICLGLTLFGTLSGLEFIYSLIITGAQIVGTHAFRELGLGGKITELRPDPASSAPRLPRADHPSRGPAGRPVGPGPGELEDHDDDMDGGH